MPFAAWAAERKACAAGIPVLRAQLCQSGAIPDCAERLVGPNAKRMPAVNVLTDTRDRAVRQQQQAGIKSCTRPAYQRFGGKQRVGRETAGVVVVAADDSPAGAADPLIEKTLHFGQCAGAARQAGNDDRLGREPAAALGFYPLDVCNRS